MNKQIVLILFTLMPFYGQTQSTKDKDSYKLVWSDEFNTDGHPDTASWGYEHGFVRNRELQWYQPENAWCKNGTLIIEAKKEEGSAPHEYTSACVLTKGKKSWQYGRFEMRGKIDISSGIWPAWWTLGVDKTWPANGEIDIMEYYRGMLLANIACLGKNKHAEWYSNRFSTDSMGGKEWAARFHIWRMDWTKDYIALYIDDRLLNKTSLDQLSNKDSTGFNPFRQPHYMLLNLAIGGANGGDPSQTPFPKTFEIDYVRVYQKE